MTNEVQMATATSGMHYCVDVVSSTEAYIAIACWGLLTAFLTFHGVGVARRGEPRRATILTSLAWLLTVLLLVGAAPGAQRTLATILYTCVHPSTSSVGFWMDFPRWPSVFAAVFAVGVRLLVEGKRKGGPNHVPEDTARKLADPQH